MRDDTVRVRTKVYEYTYIRILGCMVRNNSYDLHGQYYGVMYVCLQ
jgi:hypothetical protein